MNEIPCNLKKSLIQLSVIYEDTLENYIFLNNLIETCDFGDVVEAASRCMRELKIELGDSIFQKLLREENECNK